MDNFYNQIQHLLKTQYELDAGIYKRMPNKQRLEKFNNQLKEFQSLKEKNYYMINQTCTTDSKVGNTHKSFKNDMKPITIKEMTLGNTYKNRYIKFEIVTGILMMTSVMFLGKDDNEDIVLIAVYNFENHYGTKEYNKLSYIFQKGKFILILEPFYKMFGSGEDGIRIEDPNEIIIFDDKEWMNKFFESENKNESFKLLHDEDDKNYDYLYKIANKSFYIENYNIALINFIKLKSLKPDEIELDLKIAECYFGISYYSKTIEKCNEILNKIEVIVLKNESKFYINSLLLKIKSLFKLKKVKEAQIIINENKEIIEKNKNDFDKIEEEIKNKISNMNGNYDFSEIYYKSKRSLNIEIGEYINKKLEIKFNSKKGVFFITKEKIKKGELIMVSKAFVISDPNKKEDKKNLYFKFDNPEKEEYEKTKKLLVYKEKQDLEEILSYKLSNFPEDFNDFLNLFDGKNKNNNLSERKKNSKIDLKKIQNVIKYNSKTLYFLDKPISNGLWYYPSFFNHSCIPNCFHFGFGDILIIIAINEIESNSELNLNYLNNEMLYETRQKILKEIYDFECNCELCEYEKNKMKENEKKILDEYLKKLNNIIEVNPDEENEKKVKNKLLSINEIEEMINFIEKNKKMFSCYEKSSLYLKCAICMVFHDAYFSFEYLEKSLRYSENRNYYFEKMTLIIMNEIAKKIKNEEKINFCSKKLKEFWEKYYLNQKEFINILMDQCSSNDLFK